MVANTEQFRSRDSSVGVATGYRLDDQGAGVRVSTSSRPVLGHTQPLLSNGYLR
jgi:hypothetical protein